MSVAVTVTNPEIIPPLTVWISIFPYIFWSHLLNIPLFRRISRFIAVFGGGNYIIQIIRFTYHHNWGAGSHSGIKRLACLLIDWLESTGSGYAAQAGLELAILPWQPPECGHYRCVVPWPTPGRIFITRPGHWCPRPLWWYNLYFNILTSKHYYISR